MGITVEGKELGVRTQYTEDWEDTDLDIADGETTIVEKGAVGGAINYDLDDIHVNIATLGAGGVLDFKLYVDINGTITELTDERVQKNATGTFALFAFVSSDYFKITVQATANNNSLSGTSNWGERAKG